MSGEKVSYTRVTTSEYNRLMRNMRQTDRLKDQQAAIQKQLKQAKANMKRQQEANQRQLEAHKQAVNNQFQALEAEQAEAMQRGQSWIQATQAVLDEISALQHEKFKPNALDKLDADYQTSKQNLNHGDAQAAIAAGQQLFSKSSELKAEIEYLQAAWQMHYDLFKETSAQVLIAIETEAAAEWIFTTEEGETPLAAQIDYWTDGGFDNSYLKLIYIYL